MNPNKPAMFSTKLIMFMVLPLLLLMMASSTAGMFFMMKTKTGIWNELSAIIEKLPQDEKGAAIRNQFEKSKIKMIESQRAAMRQTMIINVTCAIVVVAVSLIGVHYIKKKMLLLAGFDLDQLETAITAYRQLGDALIKIKPDYMKKMTGADFDDNEFHDF